MYCNGFVSPYCFDGNCPVALYNEYGPDYGVFITCIECVHNTGDCDECSGCECPLDYLLAEALPAYNYFYGVRY